MIVITGGLGFQGFHIARRLLAQGRPVRIVNTPSYRAIYLERELRAGLIPGLAIPDFYSVVWGSVTDPEVVRKSLAGATHLIHLAAWTSVDRSYEETRAVFAVNVQATFQVLEAARKVAADARVLVASSCEVYGETVPGAPPVTEDGKLAPHSPYAAAKVAADRMAYAHALTYALDLTIVRPCNVFGPWQKSGPSGAVLPTFLRAAREGKPLRLTGDGSQRREFLYVTDVVDAYQLLLDRPGRWVGDTVNVGSGVTRSIRELAGDVQDRYRVSIYDVSSPGRPAEVGQFRLDSSRMLGLGWRPRVAFRAGLDETFEWADKNLPEGYPDA